MYFLPALFIVIEFLFVLLYPGLAEISAHQNFIKKNPNVKIIDNPSNIVLFSIFAIIYVLYTIGAIAYTINLLFTPLWIIGAIFLAFYFFQTIIKKIFPKLDSDSDLGCFLNVNSIDDEKLKRKFKLLELNGSSDKRKLKILIPTYLIVLFRISLYVSIIVLHYNYGLDPHMLF